MRRLLPRDWLRTITQRVREASISLLDVHSDASAGIVHALIAAEAMRTVTLLMSKFHGCPWHRGRPHSLHRSSTSGGQSIARPA
jgi:hypothetical protein